MEENSDITYTMSEDDIDKTLLEFIDSRGASEPMSLREKDEADALHAIISISGAISFALMLKDKIRGEEGE